MSAGGAPRPPELVLELRARREIRAAARWYEGQRPGLGREFVGAARAALARVEEAPLRYRAVRGGEVRRILLERFPFALFFVADPERTAVLACLHGHRDPALWPGDADAPEV